ncbi:MAG TPA: ABC transporter permease [Vicinamibacterales bacterium]|nr:ABC transporter permease [Vicinamibacterales bacterium]
MSVTRFLRRSRWDDERRRELEAHLAIETDENVARGHRPEDARALAIRKLGNPALVREEIYQMNTIGWLESVWQDLRYGARVLRRSPGFAVVALLSLALGIGANAAIFQLLDVVRLRTLPLRHPEEIVEIRIAPNKTGRTGSFNGARPSLTNPLWEQIRDGGQTLTDLFAWGTASFDMSSGGESRPTEGLFVSGGFFHALEGRAVRGRLIEPADDVRGCSPAAVISYAFWRKEFGGADDVLGRTIRLDNQVLPLLGVVSDGFSGVEIGRRTDVYVPICSRPQLKRANPALDEPSVWWLAAFGRLRPGVTVEQANAELTSRSPGIFKSTMPPKYAPADVAAYAAFQLNAFPSSTGVSNLRTRYSTSLTVLLSIAGLVLLIACANLANLMLARANARGREIALRLAIGASRRRVFRQLIAESLLLAGLGAFAGIWLALLLSRVLVSILTSDGSPWTFDLALDWRLIAFTSGLAIVACVVFGLLPALRATRTQPGVVLKLAGRGLTADRSRFLVRRILVVGQIAVSLALVVGSLLFIRTLRNLGTSDFGFSDRNVLVAELDLRPAGVAPEAMLPFQATLLERLRAVPGIAQVSSAVIVPLSGSGWNESVIIDGEKKEGHPDANRVSDSYFKTLSIPFVSGRTFDARDRVGATPVAIINEAFVAKYFPGSNPLGRTFRLEVGPGQPDPTYEVIGVVKNTKYRDLREPLGPITYFADTQESDPAPFLSVVLRAERDPRALRAGIVQALADVHPAITVTLTEMTEQVQNTLLRERLMAALSGGFAGLAVVLAAVGLYGLMSYGVARRRNEIGVRVALGATRGRIVRMIVRETVVLVAIGVAVGIGLAIWSARAAEALLYGLTPSDPWTLSTGVTALAVVAVIASIVPALRAARLNPTLALREE